MNNKIYLAALALTLGITGCNNNWEYPPMVVPTATMEPTATIAELKTRYWKSDRNYCSNIDMLNDEEDFIVKGRVVSSDATGNIFKNVVIDDGTAALTIAINAYDLYESYQYGQELVVNCTGLQIGGYNGLMQLGAESSYAGSPSMTFMSKDLFDAHAEVDGLSDVSKVVPIIRSIQQLEAYKQTTDSMIRYQSCLVKIDSVAFVDSGKKFAPDATTDRYVQDKDGNRINVRCSSYATFHNDTIPAGYGCVTGILSYYGTAWQIMLNDLGGLTNFKPYVPQPTPPSEEKGTGTADDPYNVARAIKVAEANGETSELSVYTQGYVISGSIDTEYGNGTWVINDKADGTGAKMTVYRAKDFNNAKFTDADKVKVGDLIVVYAPLINFKGNTPESNLGYLYSINGEKGGGDPEPPGGGEIYTGLVDNMDGWTIENVTLPEGFDKIWGWEVYSGSGYLKATAYNKGNFESLAYAYTTVDLAGYAKAAVSFDQAAKFQTTLRQLCGPVVRVAGEKEWKKLDVPTWCEAGAWTFANSGSISLDAYAGKKVEIGFVYGSTAEGADTWEIKNFIVTGSK